MAVDMTLKIEGIKGESKLKGHAEEVDILAWSWGMSQSASFGAGGGGGAGKVNIQDLSFTKYVDKSSPELMLACSNGKHIKSALLTVRKAGEDALEYLTIKLEKVVVSSLGAGGSGGEDRLTENVSFNFGKCTVEYQEQDDTGKAKGGKVAYGWDVQQNVKA